MRESCFAVFIGPSKQKCPAGPLDYMSLIIAFRFVAIHVARCEMLMFMNHVFLSSVSRGNLLLLFLFLVFVMSSGFVVLYTDIMTEVIRREKQAGMVPEPDVDAYMKVNMCLFLRI